MQHVLDNALHAEMTRYLRLYRYLDMPLMRAALCQDPARDADLYRVADAARAAGESSHDVAYALTLCDIVAAIETVDALARVDVA